MHIVVANPRGICAGVNRAIRIVIVIGAAHRRPERVVFGLPREGRAAGARRAAAQLAAAMP